MSSPAHRLGAVRIRPAVLDIAVAAGTFAVSLAQLAHVGPPVLRGGSAVEQAELDLVSVVLAAGSALPLLVWRRWPLVVFTMTAVASVLLLRTGHPLDLMIGPAVALYLLAASRDRTTPWTWGTTLVVVGLFVTYLAASGVAQAAFPSISLLHSGLAWAAAWFAGERTRLRRAQIAELDARVRRAERDAERDRLLAAAQERARIARDLHDSAGHAISVIAVRAGAARLRHHQDPDRSYAALAAIEELARQTAAEIDHIVGALREHDPPNRAPQALAALNTLVTLHAAAGLTVTVDSTGPAHTPGHPADQAAYRILQEALTNAARHGTGTAHVQVAYGESALDLTITNPVPAAAAPRPTGGHGMIGMRERTTLLGGDLTAERSNGTFRVHARIPYGGHPVDPAAHRRR